MNVEVVVLIIATGLQQGLVDIVGLMVAVRVLLKLLNAAVALIAANRPFGSRFRVVGHAIGNLVKVVSLHLLVSLICCSQTRRRNILLVASVFLRV